MSNPAPRQTLQQRVAAAILEGAARTFALQGEQASMNDIAAAAGWPGPRCTATSPNRQALFDELALAAVNDADAGLAAARIDEVAPEEGVVRAVRALVDVGDSFVLLARHECAPTPSASSAGSSSRCATCSSAVRPTGDIRRDITSARLTESLIGLIVGVRMSTRRWERKIRSPRSPASSSTEPVLAAHDRDEASLRPSPEPRREMDEEPTARLPPRNRIRRGRPAA